MARGTKDRTAPPCTCIGDTHKTVYTEDPTNDASDGVIPSFCHLSSLCCSFPFCYGRCCCDAASLLPAANDDDDDADDNDNDNDDREM